MTVLDRQLERRVHVVATVQGFEARAAGSRRAISDAVKPIDVSPSSDVLSYTLCVTPAHTLCARTVPVWLTLHVECL